MCESATLCGWLRAVLEKTHNTKTSAMSEILIKRRLDTLREIVEQENLEIQIVLVRSSDNLADTLTRIPKSWLMGSKNDEVAVASSASQMVDLSDIKTIHERCHMGLTEPPAACS